MDDTNDMVETEGAVRSPNRTTAIMLGVIVVLLIAVVAIILVKNGSGAGTPAPAAVGTVPADAQTKVPAGETPEQHVSAYFTAVIAGDYESAFGRLPADKQANGLETFASSVAGYQITAFTIDKVEPQGDVTVVTATATMAGPPFTYIWTFQKDGDGWLVVSRDLVMGQ